MSRAGVRLPLVGSAPSAGVSAAWPSSEVPQAIPGHAIAVVRGTQAASGAFAAMLVEALAAAGHPARRLRLETGVDIAPAEVAPGVMRARPEHMAQAAEHLLAQPHEGVRVLEGVGFVALHRPSLAVLVDGGVGPLGLDEPVRAVRQRFELVIAEPRAALAREIAARLWSTR